MEWSQDLFLHIELFTRWSRTKFNFCLMEVQLAQMLLDGQTDLMCETIEGCVARWASRVEIPLGIHFCGV
jgi:hypothetical protein